MMGYFGGDILAREIALLSGPNTDQYANSQLLQYNIICIVWSCVIYIRMQREEFLGIASCAYIDAMAQLSCALSMRIIFANTPPWICFRKVIPKSTLAATIIASALDHRKVVKLDT